MVLALDCKTCIIVPEQCIIVETELFMRAMLQVSTRLFRRGVVVITNLYLSETDSRRLLMDFDYSELDLVQRVRLIRGQRRRARFRV